MADNNSRIETGIQFSSNPEVLKIQCAHVERTTGRKDLILTWAKAIALVASSVGGALAVCLVIYFKDREMLGIIAPIYSGILAFVAARFC